jgi:hypothetical protein
MNMATTHGLRLLLSAIDISESPPPHHVVDEHDNNHQQQIASSFFVKMSEPISQREPSRSTNNRSPQANMLFDELADYQRCWEEIHQQTLKQIQLIKGESWSVDEIQYENILTRSLGLRRRRGKECGVDSLM